MLRSLRVVILASCSCGGYLAPPSPLSAGGDTGEAPSPGRVLLDAGRAQDASDASTVDLGSPPPADGELDLDAGYLDINVGSGAPSLRDRVCSEPSYPALTLPGPAELVADSYGVEGRAFDFLEGPVWLTDLGLLLFSDLVTSGSLAADELGPPTIIHALHASTGRLEVFSASGQVRSNGLAVDEMGRVVAATHDVRGVSRLDPQSAARAVLVDRFEGRRFNTTNDLVVASNGTIYFTDPAYNGQLDGRERELDKEGVYRWRPDGSLERLAHGRRPNGITLSPDEGWLYFSERGARTFWRLSLHSDGSVGAPEVLMQGRDAAADGVTMDCAGNLYLAVPERGVVVFGPDGERIGRVSGASGVTNVAFGGEDHRTLYITERRALKQVRAWPIPGLPY